MTESGDIPASATDRDLLSRFMAGDPAAVRTVGRWAREILVFKRFGVPFHDHDDVIQETLIGLMRAARAEGFELRKRLRAFVRTIAIARSIDYMRRRRPTTELDERLADPGSDPYHAIRHSEAGLRTRLALQTLDPGCREIIRLHYENDLSYAEIAEREGPNVSTMRARMFQCMKALRVLVVRLMK